MAAKRRIRKARISMISLCPAGKNKARVLFKDDGHFEIDALAKMDAEGLLTSLVYIPEHPDADEDVASAAVIKDMAHNFLKYRAESGIDIVHNMEPLGEDKVQLCETFLVQKGDPRFEGMKDEDGRPINPEGSWATVIKLHDPMLKSLYAEDGWHGVSMYGKAVCEPLTKSDFPDALARRLGGQGQETIDMDETKLATILATALKGEFATFKDELVKALKPEPETKPEPKEEPVEKAVEIEFEGDASNLDDVKAHEEKVFKASLNLNDAKDLEKWRTYLEKKQDAERNKESDELRKAREDKERAEKAYNDLVKGSKRDTSDVSRQTTESAEEKLEKGRQYGREVAQRLIKSQTAGRVRLIPSTD